jgi:NADP-dependent 3-hydroxy acid dehydrogenase YdfG
MRDGGSIILIGSLAGYKGINGYSTYSATKAAVRSYTRTWTHEFKDRSRPIFPEIAGRHADMRRRPEQRPPVLRAARSVRLGLRLAATAPNG